MLSLDKYVDTDPPSYSGGIEYSNQGTMDMSYEEEKCIMLYYARYC